MRTKVNSNENRIESILSPLFDSTRFNSFPLFLNVTIFVIRRRGWGKKKKIGVVIAVTSLRDKVTLGEAIGQESFPAVAQDTGGVQMIRDDVFEAGSRFHHLDR